MPKPDLDEIYRLYAGYVYNYLLGLSSSAQTAEELTAETFYRAVKNIGKYDSKYPLPVWLKAIAKNLFLDHMKKKQRTDIPIGDTELPESCGAFISFEDKEQALCIHKVLHTLDEPYKEVFSLRIFGELSYNEIGEIFGKTASWARTVYFRAKEKIISKLDQ